MPLDEAQWHREETNLTILRDDARERGMLDLVVIYGWLLIANKNRMIDELVKKTRLDE